MKRATVRVRRRRAWVYETTGLGVQPEVVEETTAPAGEVERLRKRQTSYDADQAALRHLWEDGRKQRFNQAKKRAEDASAGS